MRTPIVITAAALFLSLTSCGSEATKDAKALKDGPPADAKALKDDPPAPIHPELKSFIGSYFDKGTGRGLEITANKLIFSRPREDRPGTVTLAYNYKFVGRVADKPGHEGFTGVDIVVTQDDGSYAPGYYLGQAWLRMSGATTLTIQKNQRELVSPGFEYYDKK